mmetsp:Transcript_54018/g.131140  ORF Transcript_54018/g.131140 Transcript_54018/m.131140 type:complete len:100 (-) Transcript_54018:36-335(-)
MLLLLLLSGERYLGDGAGDEYVVRTESDSTSNETSSVSTRCLSQFSLFRFSRLRRFIRVVQFVDGYDSNDDDGDDEALYTTYDGTVTVTLFHILLRVKN